MSQHSTLNSQYARVKKQIIGAGLPHSDNWLQECYNWVISSHKNIGTLTDAFVEKEVYNQWLCANLEDMSSACLPLNLKQQRVVEIPGTFALQVNYIQDIGDSAYHQYNKIKKFENENSDVQATDSTEILTSWKPKARRCLYLSLTDGSQQIFGMEMEFIQNISLSMQPGSKVQVTGPVICRRGILHLKSKNIKHIGGVVEALQIPNSMENVLARALKKEQSTNPVQLQSNATYDDDSPTQLIAPPVSSTSRHNQLPPPPAASASVNSTRSQLPPATSTVTSSTNQSEEFNSSDDDIFLFDEADLIRQSETSSSNPLPPSTKNPPEVITLDDSPASAPAPETPKRKTPVRTRKSAKLKNVSKEPYQYIKQIKNGDTEKLVWIKGIISTLTSNIQVDKTSGEWKLNVNINDGSDYLDARIAPVVLDKIIGFTPSHMKQLKSSTKASDKAKVTQGLSKLTNVLVHFSGMIQIQICDNEMLITDMSELTNDHVHALLSRTSQLN